MEAMAILAAIDASVTLVEKLAPMIQAMAAKGEITVEEQQGVWDRINSLRTQQAGEYQNDGWKQG